MNKEEAKNLAKYCAKLWPNQVTQELSIFAVNQFLPNDAKLSRKAIEQHRAEPNNDGFLNWGRLFEACRTAERSATLATTTAKDRSFADVQRSLSPCFNGMNDAKVTLCVFRHHWRIALARNPQGIDLPSKPSGTQIQHAASIAAFRSSIGNSCTMLLMTAGMTSEEAPKWTPTIFEPSVEYFRQCMDELSGWKPQQQPQNQVELALAV